MLIVTSPFRGYQKGQQITDEAEVRMILASESASNVVRVADAPADKPQPKSKANPEKKQ